MPRTEIDGSQVQDETITSSDVLDESLKAVDLDIENVATGIAANPIAAATIVDLVKFGQNYSFAATPIFNTSNPNFEIVAGVSFTAPVGMYRFQYSFTITNSKSNTDSECRVTHNGSILFTRIQAGLQSSSIGSLDGNIAHSGGTLSAAIELKRIAGNGNAMITDAKIEVWRIA